MHNLSHALFFARILWMAVTSSNISRVLILAGTYSRGYLFSQVLILAGYDILIFTDLMVNFLFKTLETELWNNGFCLGNLCKSLFISTHSSNKVVLS